MNQEPRSSKQSSHQAMNLGSRSLHGMDRRSLPQLMLKWGCQDWPLEELAPHFLILGTPGSGKTLLQKMFMMSLLPDAKHGIAYRAAIFDPKRELYPFLVRMGVPAEHILITHPYDERCVAWDLAADFTDEGHAKTLSNALIPIIDTTNETKTADFWVNVANQTLHHVIVGLMKASPGSWDLRDITEGCSHPDTLRQLMRLTPSGRNSERFYFEGRKELASDILATLRSHMREFEPLAALCHRARQTFSIRDWRKGSGILLLGTDPERPQVLKTLNNLIIQRMSQILLAHLEEQPTDLTWLFFDELREAGRFTGFHTLLTMGRSKGVRVMLGFQDVSGLKATFGADEAEEILAICDNKAILHLGSPESAKWASDLFAETLQEVESRTITHNQHQSRTFKEELVREALPIQFYKLRLAQNSGGAIEGFFHSPGLMYRRKMPPHVVDEAMPPAPIEQHRQFIERSPDDQEPASWVDADYERFRIRKPETLTRAATQRRELQTFDWYTGRNA